MRVGKLQTQQGPCFGCVGHVLHDFHRILPTKTVRIVFVLKRSKTHCHTFLNTDICNYFILLIVMIFLMITETIHIFFWVSGHLKWLATLPAGVVTVGYASVAGDSSGKNAANASAVLFGVTLTLLGQVVQAAQAAQMDWHMLWGCNMLQLSSCMSQLLAANPCFFRGIGPEPGDFGGIPDERCESSSCGD